MKYAAAILSLGTIASYILGVVRDILFSRYYDASGLTDAYFSAFLLSDICLMIFVASALLGSMTPIYIREKTKNTMQGLLVFGNFYTYIPGIFLFISILGILATPVLFPFFFPKLFAQYPTECVQLGQMFFLSNTFFAFSNVLGNFLMTEKKFISTALSPLLYNIGIIGGILLGASSFGIIAAGMGGVIGSIFHLLIRVYEYKNQSVRFPFPVFSISNELKELWGSMLFRWTTVALFPLMLIGMSRFAGQYSEGLYTLFLYSRNIISAPVAIFGVAFATASFSHLSQLKEKGEGIAFHEYFFDTIKKVLFWTIPTAVGVFFLGTEFLEYLYKQGETAEEHFILQSFIMTLSIAIPFESVNNVLARTMNALGMEKVLVSSNLLFLASVFGITFASVHFFHIPSFAMASGYTLAFIIQVLYIWFFLSRHTFLQSSSHNTTDIHSIFQASLWASGGMFLFLLTAVLTTIIPLLVVFIGAIIIFLGILIIQIKKISLIGIIKKMM